VYELVLSVLSSTLSYSYALALTDDAFTDNTFSDTHSCRGGHHNMRIQLIRSLLMEPKGLSI